MRKTYRRKDLKRKWKERYDERNAAVESKVGAATPNNLCKEFVPRFYVK